MFVILETPVRHHLLKFVGKPKGTDTDAYARSCAREAYSAYRKNTEGLTFEWWLDTYAWGAFLEYIPTTFAKAWEDEEV